MKKTLRRRLERTKSEAQKRRRERRKQLNRELDTDTPGPKSQFLKLVDIKELRVLDKSGREIGAIPYDTMRYADWERAKAKRARPWAEEEGQWYVVANPPEPFIPLNRRTVRKYLHGSTWWKR